MIRRVIIALLIVFAIAALAPAGVVVIHAHTGLADAKDLLAHQLWPQARQRLTSYLWLHSRDWEAHVLLAEACAKDSSLPSEEGATQAIHYLARVPDGAPLASLARLQQGRLTFLILQKPTQAEGLLREAIRLGAGLEAHQLLFTILCMTGRAEESEDTFWKVYELSSDDERPLRLRDWYMSQVFPLTANEPLDRVMGLLGPQESPAPLTESRRFLRFREREPQSPIAHAAVAQWCQDEGDPEFADRVLQAAEKELPHVKSNSFYLSVAIATYLDLGQFQRAQEYFQLWPSGHRGQAYWKWRAIIHDDVLHQYEEALAAYERALTMWPGPLDWRLHFRRLGCLARSKKTAEIPAAKEQADRIQGLMDADLHDRLRTAVGSLDDPAKLAEVVEFYRAIRRDREVKCWERHIQRIQGLAGLPGK